MDERVLRGSGTRQPELGPPLDVWKTDVDVVYSFDLPGILQEQCEEVASMTELLHVIERGKENLLLVEEYLPRASGGESPLDQGPPPAAGGAL